MAANEPTTAELWAGLLDWLGSFDHGSEAVKHVNLVDTPGQSTKRLSSWLAVSSRSLLGTCDC